MLTYNIVTNNNDEWLDDKKEAIELFDKWAKENGSARLYEFDTDTEDEDGVYADGKCLKSFEGEPL